MATNLSSNLICLSLILLLSFSSSAAFSTSRVSFSYSNLGESSSFHKNTPNIVNELVKSVNSTPIVLWHGMGDTCCSPLSLGKIIKLLYKELPGTYVTSLQLGSTTKSDFTSGYFGSVNEQVAHACNLIATNDNLVNGYHAIGFSQGSQFLRAVAQRCPSPPMKTLITLGGQHQGVFGLPHCPGDSKICSIVRSLLDMGAYTKFVQGKSVQAQYWHDPIDFESYIKYSTFLADINNEREPRNSSYKVNLSKLQKLILVMFNDDTMVVPKESSLFAYYANGANGTSTIVPLNQSAIYTEDRIGLRTLQQSGRLITYTVPGDHLQLDMKWFIDEIVHKYLK